MIEINKIKLQTTSILNIPFQTYENDFTFIVNNKKYHISRFAANLLSPIICKMQISDPTINEFSIITNHDGDFQQILNLLNFEDNNLCETDISFTEEIIKILGNESIDFSIGSETEEITISNVIDRISKHEKHHQFYSKSLQKEIEFISSHFHEISINQEDEFIKLSIETLENILSKTSLQLKSEDQLLEIINKLYSKNSKYSTLYEFVDFTNVTSSKIADFLNIYDINDLTQEMWKKLSKRLQQKILKDSTASKSRYHLHEVIYQKNHEFEGIINYLKMLSKGKINNEINITSSSQFDESCEPKNAILFENKYKNFISKNCSDSWLCIEFKNHHVIPTNYTLCSYNCSENGFHPKSWVIEGSNDNKNWDLIDTQEDCSLLNGYNLIHTFKIEKLNEKEYRYLRMRTTNPNWNGFQGLAINSIEFYGKFT